MNGTLHQILLTTLMLLETQSKQIGICMYMSVSMSVKQIVRKYDNYISDNSLN